MVRALFHILISLALLTGTAARSDQALAQSTAGDVLSAVVRLTAEIPPEARTAGSLGTSREGNAVIIDGDGLVLTIGYLVLEAMAVTLYEPGGAPVQADFVAYDHRSGFGLVRARGRLAGRPIRLGKSTDLAVDDHVLVAAYGGLQGAMPAAVVSRREFAGYWEYLLEEAIFTAPPHPYWSGAALVGPDGTLLGVGSLIVGDAYRGDGVSLPGNMFVPIDLLKPILGDLLSEGRRTGARQPWLGIFSRDVDGGALVIRVAPGGPAERAGIQVGDIVRAVAGQSVADVPDFYRKVWATGEPGSSLVITVRRGSQALNVDVVSGDRADYLHLRPSY